MPRDLHRRIVSAAPLFGGLRCISSKRMTFVYELRISARRVGDERVPFHGSDRKVPSSRASKTTGLNRETQAREGGVSSPTAMRDVPSIAAAIISSLNAWAAPTTVPFGSTIADEPWEVRASA